MGSPSPQTHKHTHTHLVTLPAANASTAESQDYWSSFLVIGMSQDPPSTSTSNTSASFSPVLPWVNTTSQSHSSHQNSRKSVVKAVERWKWKSAFSYGKKGKILRNGSERVTVRFLAKFEESQKTSIWSGEETYQMWTSNCESFCSFPFRGTRYYNTIISQLRCM